MGLMWKVMRKIITENVYPPIPLPDFDWCAYREGDEEIASKHGWGATEAEAIADLKRLEAEEE
jgi:hypothetical protein